MASETSSTTPETRGAFPATRWSVVAAARRSSPDSTVALETLCRAYWYPLYAYARRGGLAAHDAQDLTQEFFHRLLEKGWLESAERERGRLRTFLIVAFKRFSANEWDRRRAARRGGGRVHEVVDSAFAESRFAADPRELGPDETFDRQWAITLLGLASSRLREEFVSAGKPGDYETLKPCLLAERGDIDYAALAGRLGANESAARVAVHRLRKRYREIFREEIRQTLAEGEDLEAELRHLAAVLARG